MVTTSVDVLLAKVSTASTLGTYFLFIVAGLLVGGTWSLYKAGSRVGTFILGALSVIALAGAVLWLIGVIG